MSDMYSILPHGMGSTPIFAIYEPGFMRAGTVLARAAAGTRIPVLYRFMFCNLLAVGFPPRPYALAAYLALLEEEAPRRAPG